MPRVRFVVRVLALGACLAAGVAHCAETRRAVGEQCLKDEDCLSGVCAAQECIAAPPLLEAEPPLAIEAGESSDAPSDTLLVPMEAARESAAPEASPDAKEGGKDAGHEGGG